MSRNLLIVLVVMCAAIAAMLVYPKFRKAGSSQVPAGDTAQVTPAPTGTQPVPPAPTPTVIQPPVNNNNATTVTPTPAIPDANPQTPRIAVIETGKVVRGGVQLDPEMLDRKPLPVLEKNYLATTNRDDRLDIMMDITDWPGPEAVKALARLFQTESDPDLKVDLLDSLLGIEGQVEEKLAMLALGTAKGLPTEVRQSAIDGLIDLDDQRVIPILNGLLNDPDEEIREGAKDAIEMLQAQPAVKLQPGGKGLNN